MMQHNPLLTAHLNKLYNENALDILLRLPEQTIDLVFTDPPYSSGGTHATTRANSPSKKYIGSNKTEKYPDFDHDNKDQRSWTFWCATWLSQAYRVIKKGGHLVCFIDWRQLPALTDAVQYAGFIWRGIAVWDKTAGGTRPRMGGFKQQSEYMVWATKGHVPRRRSDGKTVYLPGVFSEHLASNKKVHMTQKPPGLAKEVMRLVAPGSVVLDPFAGSGTFLVAAQEAGHSWIGCEIEPTYYEIAQQRLARSFDSQEKIAA